MPCKRDLPRFAWIWLSAGEAVPTVFSARGRARTGVAATPHRRLLEFEREGPPLAARRCPARAGRFRPAGRSILHQPSSLLADAIREPTDFTGMGQNIFQRCYLLLLTATLVGKGKRRIADCPVLEHGTGKFREPADRKVDATKADGNEETCLLVLKRRPVAAPPASALLPARQAGATSWRDKWEKPCRSSRWARMR